MEGRRRPKRGRHHNIPHSATSNVMFIVFSLKIPERNQVLVNFGYLGNDDNKYHSSDHKSNVLSLICFIYTLDTCLFQKQKYVDFPVILLPNI